jgi:hypothetical protein
MVSIDQMLKRPEDPTLNILFDVEAIDNGVFASGTIANQQIRMCFDNSRDFMKRIEGEIHDFFYAHVIANGGDITKFKFNLKVDLE